MRQLQPATALTNTRYRLITHWAHTAEIMIISGLSRGKDSVTVTIKLSASFFSRQFLSVQIVTETTNLTSKQVRGNGKNSIFNALHLTVAMQWTRSHFILNIDPYIYFYPWCKARGVCYTDAKSKYGWVWSIYNKNVTKDYGTHLDR